ncbi:zonular occludens toxin domain-containing protein, partial [Pseudomonas aeruginosa]
MINLILGQPGGGKSHEAVVYHVVPALNQGRKVITNLAL